jgi:hypothetical protein
MKPTAPLPFALALALALAACAATEPNPSSAAAAGQKSVPKTEQQLLKNLGAFDIAIFTLEPPAIPSRVNNDVLTGVETAARPLILECLVDPKNRGADDRTKVIVDAALTDAGVDHKVTGQNLTPAGIACVEEALKKWTQAAPNLNAKAAMPAGAPVKSQVPFDHMAGTNPSVTLGVNDASDIAGAIRLALPNWSDCFTDWKSAPPRQLSATVKVARPKPPAPQVTLSEVTFAPTGDAGADKVAACLKTKMLALQVKAPSGDSVTVPYPFRFGHSGLSELLPGATADLQFTQFDLLRAQRLAESAVALGGRNATAAAYDDAIKRYKAKSADSSVAELREKCAALLAADDKAVEVLQKQLAVKEATHRFAQEQMAKDPAWAQAEAASAKELPDARKDVETFKKARKSDEGTCPKSSD